MAQLGGTRTSHRWSEMPGNWDKLNTRSLFASNNSWGIPDLAPAPLESMPKRLVAYNDRYGCDTARDGDMIHFFLDDYRFETCWSKPERPLPRLAKVGAALTPDFSLWRDMPLVMQLWQVYRSRWCGAWMAQHGIQVIPTVSWSTPDTFDFAFAGITAGSVIAVSTVGVTRGDQQARQLFEDGYTAMLQQLAPASVLVYGQTPPQHLTQAVPAHVYPTRWQR